MLRENSRYLFPKMNNNKLAPRGREPEAASAVVSSTFAEVGYIDRRVELCFFWNLVSFTFCRWRRTEQLVKTVKRTSWRMHLPLSLSLFHFLIRWQCPCLVETKLKYFFNCLSVHCSLSFFLFNSIRFLSFFFIISHNVKCLTLPSLSFSLALCSF